MTNNYHPNTTATARSYQAGTSPDHPVFSPFIPVLLEGDRHVRCSCTWGDGGNGQLRLRLYHLGCRVKEKDGHE